MRHGIAEDESASGADADRQLTDDGRRKVLEAARGLKEIGVKPEVVISSPLPRALDTAKLTASVLDRDLQVETVAALDIGYDAAAVAASLGAYVGASSILVVGHQPQLGELASLLLTGSHLLAPLPFKKGAVAAIDVESLPPRSAGVLAWFMAPKQLRALA